jgi:hypothetical protein
MHACTRIGVCAIRATNLNARTRQDWSSSWLVGLLVVINTCQRVHGTSGRQTGPQSHLVHVNLCECVWSLAASALSSSRKACMDDASKHRQARACARARVVTGRLTVFSPPPRSDPWLAAISIQNVSASCPTAYLGLLHTMTDNFSSHSYLTVRACEHCLLHMLLQFAQLPSKTASACKYICIGVYISQAAVRAALSIGIDGNWQKW